MKTEQKLVRFDWAMKHLLRNKANYDIVEGFLCALLEDNNLHVVEVLESEGNKESEFDKFNRVDVVVRDQRDRKILIEIQNTKESDYLYRMVYGASKSIAESIDSGDKYQEIEKIISVSILYFDLGIGEDYLYYGKTDFVGINTHEIITKNSEKVQKLIPKNAKYNGIEIFPEYYIIQVKKYKNIIQKAIDEWVYWFKNEKIADGSKSKHIKKVQDKLDLLKMNQKQRAEYQKYLERLASEKDMINTALDDGKELGRIEAEQKLIPLIKQEQQKVEQKELELEQERQKVELERQKLIETVKKLKEKNFSNQEISEITGLSIGEIENI